MTVDPANTINASLAPYSVLIGGAGNGAISYISPPGGFAVLQSQGSGANPKTATLKLVVRQVFKSSGTYTPTSGMVSVFIECVGSGSSGGGSTTGTGAGVMSGGSGGMGGCIARGAFTSTSIGASQTVTVAAAAAGAAAGTGKAGGFSSVGSLISSGTSQNISGTGTNRVTKALCNITCSNNATGGQLLTNGSAAGEQACMFDSADSLQFAFGGVGCGGFYGGGGNQVFTTTAATGITSGNATSYGGGSAGSCSTAGAGGSGLSSGTSGAGIVIITEFIAS